MTEASSRPTRPKQMTPKEFRTKRGFAGIRKSAAVREVPKRSPTMTPRAISRTPATKVPRPPTLLIHLPTPRPTMRSEEHTSELQSHHDLVCRLLLEKKKKSLILNKAST